MRLIYAKYIILFSFVLMFLCRATPAASHRHRPLQIVGRLNSAPAVVQKPSCSATGDLEIVPFESRVFPVARNLRVLLPRGYHNAANRNRKYPVLYLNDGQDLFDICTSLFNHEEWRVDETVNDLIATGQLPPLIAAAVES